MSRKNNQKKDEGLYVYIGPSVRAVALTGATYYGTAEAVRDMTAALTGRFPEAGCLIVPVERLAAAKREAGSPGRALFQAVSSIREKINKGE